MNRFDRQLEGGDRRSIGRDSEVAASFTLDPPVRGQWAIMNPPGHAKLAFDFLAVDESKSPYTGAGLLRHIFSTIPIGEPRISVFTATLYAHGVDYHCGNAK